MILFTHLKIILLQCFQFSVINDIQTNPKESPKSDPIVKDFFFSFLNGLSATIYCGRVIRSNKLNFEISKSNKFNINPILVEKYCFWVYYKFEGLIGCFFRSSWQKVSFHIASKLNEMKKNGCAIACQTRQPQAWGGLTRWSRNQVNLSWTRPCIGKDYTSWRKVLRPWGMV